MASVSVEKLKQLVDSALKDNACAERIFQEPDAVAEECGFSEVETLVLKQMNRELFASARKDIRAETGELSDMELAAVAGGGASQVCGFVPGTNTVTTADGTTMIIGRAIAAAGGGNSYLNATNTCNCCSWKPKITTGALALPG